MQLISSSGAIQESFTAVLTFTSQSLSSFSITPVPFQTNEPSMHEIAFTTPYYIPASKVQTSASELVSFIKIVYAVHPTNTPAGVVSTSLGYGVSSATVIPCKSLKGLNAISGVNINCTLYPGTAPYIIVQNYGEVQATGQVLILLPLKLNPTNWISFNVYVVTKQNRLLNELSVNPTTALQFSASAYSTTTITGAGISFYSYTNTTIFADFGVTFNSQFVTTLIQTNKINVMLPKFDVGLLPSEDQVTCKVVTTSYNCYQFPNGLDWVYGGFASTMSQFVNSTDSWNFTNLRWPRYDITTTMPGNLIIYIYQLVSGKYTVQMKLQYDPFNTPSKDTFVSTALNVDKKHRKETDVTYTFTFVAKNDIPSGGSLTLTLPTDYNLIASYPAVRITYPEFTNASSTAPVSHYYTANTVTIYNIGLLYRKTEFRVIIAGMRNPDVSASMNTFSVVTKLNNYPVNYATNFITVTLESVFSPGQINVNSISVFPINRVVSADYLFAFNPQTKLSSGAEIHIVFPADYLSLPQNPSCNVWGGITTFELCYKLANEIIMRLDSSYNTDVIYFKIYGVTNPDVSQTSAFEIYTTYDGATIDETDSSTGSTRKLTLSAKAGLLSMRQFSFDPVNEGEVAKYTISFIPTNTIEKGMNIYIKFPDTFDARLGKQVDIYVAAGLSGDIKTALSDRVVTISGFNAYSTTSTTPVQIVVNGVINPNKPATGNSGYISVGTIYPSSNTFVNYLEKAASVLTTAAPGWLTVNNLQSSNLYSRTSANYTINITATNKIVKSTYGGKILVDLPVNYEIANGTYRILNKTANLGVSLKCTQQDRLITVNGHPGELIGDVAYTIQGVKNPLDEVVTESFFVRTYDGTNQEIIQRSFENLDPFKLNFTYPGPLIIVNDGQPIYCERGTQTKDLYIILTEIAALNLTLIPITPGFSFVPEEIKINIGQIKVKFRVSVPMGFSEGEYTVTWVTKGDLESPIYTPVKKTTVVITGKGNIPISISAVNDVPYQGNSLPILFTTDYAPDIGVEVLVGLAQNYLGIGLDKQSVEFLAGDNLNTFMVLFPHIGIFRRHIRSH